MGEYSGPISPASKYAQLKLRDYAMTFPGAEEHHPWGEIAVKVKNKVFVFLSAHGKGFGMSAKLPISRAEALDNDFAEPTGYGLGKSGWVSARFDPGVEPPLETLKPWINESYRAIAPAKFVAALDGGPMPQMAASRKPAARRTSRPRKR
jgi:predicted DNA-binding protein (MmcQ/YjbR family)